MELYTKHDIELLNEAMSDLEKAIDNKKLEVLSPNRDRKMAAINIVIKFVKDNNRIIYGGTAQNAIIKKKNKDDAFYDDDEIPDIDFYSFEPILDTKKICNALFNAKFDVVEGRAAVHEETYKTHAEHIDTSDASYVPKFIYHNIPTQTIDGIRYADYEFVMIDLYRMLTEPFFSAKMRWIKAFKRLYLLQKNYPFKKATTSLPIIDTKPPKNK